MIERARRIIQANEPPDKIGKEDYFECRWCSFKEICHGDRQPDRGCRTCIHSTPVEDGNWHCARFGKILTMDEQLSGCPAHTYLPKLVPYEVLSANDKGITYKVSETETWFDGEI
jgi:hypothetical protein